MVGLLQDVLPDLQLLKNRIPTDISEYCGT